MDRAKVEAEIAKLIAETSKLNAETRWYPMVVMAGFFAVVITLTKLFL